MTENCLCIVFRMNTKRKHNEVTLKTKYEALKEFDKKRPDKEATMQFNIPRITLSTWNQPILTIFCWIDCFWIFRTAYRGNYRRGRWKWRWRIQWTNCTSLKKWSWRDNQNVEQIKSVHRGFKFWSFNLKANPHNQSVKRWMRLLSISNFLNPFVLNIPFSYPLKTSEDLTVQKRNGALGTNGLNSNVNLLC